MKRLLLCVIVVSFVLTSSVSFAAMPWQKDTKVSLENVTKDSVIDKVGDWFATRGKTDDEKQAILAQRRTQRASEKAQAEAAKAKAQLEKKMAETKKAIGK